MPTEAPAEAAGCSGAWSCDCSTRGVAAALATISGAGPSAAEAAASSSNVSSYGTAMLVVSPAAAGSGSCASIGAADSDPGIDGVLPRLGIGAVDGNGTSGIVVVEPPNAGRASADCAWLRTSALPGITRTLVVRGWATGASSPLELFDVSGAARETIGSVTSAVRSMGSSSKAAGERRTTSSSMILLPTAHGQNRDSAEHNRCTQFVQARLRHQWASHVSLLCKRSCCCYDTRFDTFLRCRSRISRLNLPST